MPNLKNIKINNLNKKRMKGNIYHPEIGITKQKSHPEIGMAFIFFKLISTYKIKPNTL